MLRLKFIAGILTVSMAMNALAGTDIMFCGSTSRTGADLYSGAGPYTESTGCNPDVNVQQAMLVTRSGTIAGNGAAWLAYLNAGGNIITEYSITDNVYNEIYGTAYAQGTRFGNCQDNVMPEVKLNPADPFWVANNIDETVSGESNCGYAVDAIVAGEADVTALGESAGATYFAYREQGSGTFYLLEADWQDSQLSYSDDSKTLMGVLISGVAAAAPAPQAVAVPLSNSAKALLALLFASSAFFFFRRRSINV